MLTQTAPAASDNEEPLLPPPDQSSSRADGARTSETPPTDVAEAIRRRFLSPHTLISFAAAVAILWFVVSRLQIDPAALWAQVQRANPALLAVAFVIWYGEFFVRGWRWGRMLDAAGLNEAHGCHIPATPGLAQIVLLGYFANCIVPAKLGDAYRAYLINREGNVPMSSGFGTIVAERLVDAMMLVAVLSSTAFVVFQGALPVEARPALMLGGFLVVCGIVGLVLLWVTRDSVLRFLPERARGIYSRLQGAVFGALRRPLLVSGVGILLWCGDGMRVWFVARSLDANISPVVAILVATMGALLTVVPFTPAGLGVVELGVGAVLVGVLGFDPVLAGSILLLDRVVAYWSLLVVGVALYAWRSRRDYLPRGAAGAGQA
jgi:uncharacterized protein (TIRG00374 family)